MNSRRRDVTLPEWWRARSRMQKRAVLALAAAELVTTSTALLDLARRPAAQLRGPKAMWVLLFTVQPVGPVAYLVVGRRPDPTA